MTFKDDPHPKFVLPVVVEYEIPHERLSDLLISAFEGGSNYWYRIEGFIRPRVTPLWVQARDMLQFRHGWYALAPGGAVKVSDFKGVEGDLRAMSVKTIRTADLLQGLKVMAKKYPEHFGNFMHENDDAETADVFLQCVVFGELIYG